ncbi:tumor necrosis factor receptor superfamily member 14-like isoform X2 [Antechinus flavipes]|uniref:tumor necrosis factor receptor superfamily member 14-like isoform X2 n=1 Tax=Antechinus flavipes TaxID=38775 RepID=UPI002235CAE8|nr:tumor necrosis factor receptor superfamily member 14-like isoform X2 [Antechinus flavipes]
MLMAHALECVGGLYEVDSKCCYPCDPGYRRDGPCNITRGTRCVPCDPETYTTHKHVLNKCLLCKVCNSELGLVTRRECSSTSNTVCGCSPGYFCTDMKNDDCKQCEPHRVCSTGQYVKTRGTERSNTICEKCQAGTFSTNGTLNFCLPWTNCTAQGLYEERPGTAITDARCSQDSHHQNMYFFSNLAFSSIFFFFFVIIIIILILRYRKKNTQDKEVSIEAQPSNQASNSLLKTPFLKTLPGVTVKKGPFEVTTPTAARSRVLDSPIISQKNSTTNDEMYRANIFSENLPWESVSQCSLK